MPTQTVTFLLQLCPLPAAFVCGRTRFSANEVHITRYNPDYILLFMLHGTLWFTENGRETCLEAGEWYVQLPDMYQSGLRPSPDAEYYYIHFRPSVFPRGTDTGLFPSGEQAGVRLPLRGRYEDDSLLPLLEQLRQQMGRPDNIFAQQTLFLRILDIWMRTASQYTGSFSDIRDPLPQRIMSLLCREYASSLDRAALEHEFHYTYDYLCRVFRREYGQTPLQYLAGLRNRWARELLAFTDKPLSDIAGQMGYADAFAFSKRFRQRNGISPSDFRRAQRKISSHS
mgnify:CR=1 FL=1